MPETLHCPSCWNMQTQTLETDCLCYYPANTNRRMMSVLQSIVLYILRIAPAVAMKLLVLHHQCKSLQFGLAGIELAMCSNIVLSFSSSINVESVQGKTKGTGIRFFCVIYLLDIGLVFTTAKNFFYICVKKVVTLF